MNVESFGGKNINSNKNIAVNENSFYLCFINVVNCKNVANFIAKNI